MEKTIKKLIDELKIKGEVNGNDYAIVIADELENIINGEEFKFLIKIISTRIPKEYYEKLVKFLGF